MSHPSPKWENIEFVPANWSHYGGDIESFLNISDESGENSSLPNNTFLLRNVRQYYDFEPPILIVSLLPFSISIVLQAFAINYEKTEMDPMKRGFTNQVRMLITSQNCKLKYFGTIKNQTSRFPHIGSWFVLFTVLTQHVMAAICFRILISNYAFKLAFIVLLIRTVSPSHLCRLPIYVVFLVCVGHIVWVTLCGSVYVYHIL